MNSNDYEKRFGMKLKDAYMKETVGELMSRDEFHRLIKKAERVTKKRRVLTGVAAAGVALCLIFGGFVAGMSMRESASAGKDDETKTLQQGNGVVIGSGISENDQNVGVSTKTYTNIEDIPEDIRKEIHFLDSDEFELEKVKIIHRNRNNTLFILYYRNTGDKTVKITEERENSGDKGIVVFAGEEQTYRDLKMFKEVCDEGISYSFVYKELFMNVLLYDKGQKIEAIIDDLIDNN